MSHHSDPLNSAELCDRITGVSKPVLVWLGPAAGEGTERIELSGPVARRWLSKTDNFMASEFPFGGESFCVTLPAHWRTPFWFIVPWLRGMRYEGCVSEGANAAQAASVDLVISDDVAFLEEVADEGGPDALVAQTQNSLSLAWDGELPDALLDGTADVMSYGDWVEDPDTAPDGCVLMTDDLVIEDLRGTSLVADLVALDPQTGTRVGPAVLSSDTATMSSGLAGKRVLVRTSDPALFSAQLVQLWMADACVVWAPAADTAPELIAQESCDLAL